MFVHRKMILAFCLFPFSAVLCMEELPDFASLSIEVIKLAKLCPEQIQVEMGCIAAGSGDLESLKQFIDSSNVNKLGNKGLTPLQLALGYAFKSKDETKYAPILDYLFSLKAEIQKPVPGGKRVSALGLAAPWACLENYTRPLEILLARGAKPFIPCTDDNTTAARLCVVTNERNQQGTTAALKLFESYAANLSDAIECLSVEKTKQFAAVNAAETRSEATSNALTKVFALYKYKIKEALPLFEVLFLNGANPNNALQDHHLPGYTFMLLATMHALETGDSKLIDLSLAHGGNPKYKAFPMAPSAIEMVKIAAKIDSENSHIAKVRALFTDQ